MSDLFISDLHLAPERPAVTRAFFDFLITKANQAENLYILGDLVEAWIGDDDPMQLSREIITKLKNLTQSGTKVYFTHGNRDFLIGKRFARETGVVLLDEYQLLETSAGMVLVCHGDTLCTDDVDYQKFRRKVRNPIYRWLLAHLPLKTRQQIARKWRQKSRDANSNKATNIMDVNQSTVNSVMQKSGASLLIHGHTHRPGIHDIDTSRRRLVLGDWDRQGWYAEIVDNSVKLNTFDISK